MAQNAENIEAKLCAYVDGELDARGRAEIEKHLQSNPQHRRLLESLAKTHRFVAELPRENAPEEIMENLQNQLERAVLLDETGLDESDVVLKINRWPQLTSVAAIVLLTVGLGMILYYMLPPLKGQPDTYSTIQGKTQTPELPEPQHIAKEQAPAAPAPGRTEAAGGAPQAMMARKAEPAEVKQGETDAIENVKRRLSAVARQEGSANAEPKVLLVVNTDNPPVTQRQVLAYLQSNQIHWNPVREAALAVPVTPLSAPPDQTMARQDPGQAAPSPATTLPADISSTTQPSDQPDLEHKSVEEQDDLIICQDMTIQQANELADVLPTWRNGQRAIVVRDFEVAQSSQIAQSTQPSTMPVVAAQAPAAPPAEDSTALMEQHPQTTQPAGPIPPIPASEPYILHLGDRVQIQISLEADLELKKVMLIGQTGTITLPLVGEIQAAGLTEAQLAEAIAESYRSHNISQQPQVQVSYLDPAKQPPGIAVAIYLQNESTPPTTSQTEPTTEPSEDMDAPPPPTSAPTLP